MKKLLITLTCMAMPASLFAEQWQVLGTRPMGMGGAFVAVAQGPIAQYWNPAGLVKSSANVSGMDIHAGADAEFTGDLIKNASEIGKMAPSFKGTQTAQRGGTAMNAGQMAAFAKTVTLMSKMNKPGTGALVEAAGGANFKFSKVALSVNNFVSIGLNPYIDTTNIGLSANAGAGITGVKMNGATTTDPADTTTRDKIAGAITTIGYNNLQTLICGSAPNCLTTQNGGIINPTTLANALYNQALASGQTPAQITASANEMAAYAPGAAPLIAAASSGASYTNNNSNLTVAGASFMEVAAGYAWNKDNWLKGLSVGGNVKMVNGRTTVTTFKFLADSKTSNAFTLKDMKSSWQPAVDLGLLWNVRTKYPNAPLRPRVGLVMRNINSPSFATTSGSKYKLNRQARLGFALNPAKFWTIAMDMDVTKNKTAVTGFNSRELALGTEINIVNRKAFNIPLRAGIISNLAEKSSKMAYTVGTGLNLLFMHFDVSGVVSSEKTQLEDKSIPTKVGVAASFGLLF
jgi:hypothetical protein